MLAASRSSSNVPPDHLEAAPVIAFTNIATEKFDIAKSISRGQAQTGQPGQNDTARTQSVRLPGAAAATALDSALGIDAQYAASGISKPIRDPLVSANRQPAQGDQGLEASSDRQLQGQHQPDTE
jgi:hypothetical protein